MIDFNSYYILVLQVISNNILITIALGVALCLSLYKKPEITVKFLALCFFLVTIFYTMSLLSQSSTQEDTLIHKSERAINDYPH